MFIIIFHSPLFGFVYLRGSSRSLWKSTSACLVLGRVSMKKEIEKCATNEDFTGTSRHRPVILCYVYLFMLSSAVCFLVLRSPLPSSSHRLRLCTISRNCALLAPSSCSPPPSRGFFCTKTEKTYEIGSIAICPQNFRRLVRAKASLKSPARMEIAFTRRGHGCDACVRDNVRCNW